MEETTNLEAARRALTHEFIRSLREGDGCVLEADSELNEANRRVVHEMCEEHGGCWLGKVNLYGDERHGGAPVMWEWDRTLVYNFSCAFAVPRHDAELERLIRERDDAPYTGTTDDVARISAIYDRIERLGGVSLHWS